MDHVTETICDQPSCEACYLGLTRKANPWVLRDRHQAARGDKGTLRMSAQPGSPRTVPSLEALALPWPLRALPPSDSVPCETPPSHLPALSSVAWSPVPCPWPQFPYVLSKQSRSNSLGPLAPDSSAAHPHKSRGPPRVC